MDHPGLSVVDAEAVVGGLFVAADDHDRARAHVLLLADDPCHAVLAVFGERVLGVLEQVGPLRGRWRGHRWWQIDQPARVGGKAAHHLQGRGSVLLADGDRAGQLGLDDPLAGDVLDVEHERGTVIDRRGRG